MSDVEDFVKEFCSKLDDPRAAEKHINRIRNTAIGLCEEEDADEEIVEVAAMLYGVAKHDKAAAKKFLEKLDMDNDEKETVSECIDMIESPCHDHSEPELKVVQTADVMATLSDDDWMEEQMEEDPHELLMKVEKLAKRICIDSAEEEAEEIIEKIKKNIDPF